MTDREKLIEVLAQFAFDENEVICDGCGRWPLGEACAKIADHLIANGVRLEEKQVMLHFGKLMAKKLRIGHPCPRCRERRRKK